MLLVLAAACGETKTIEVPGETIIVEKEVVKTIEVEVPGETVTTEVVRTVEVPGETVVVEKVRTVVEQVEVEVAGETIIVEKEVVKTVEVPGETIIVEKEVVKTVEVIKTIEVPKEVIRTVIEYETIEKQIGAPTGEIHVALGYITPMVQLCALDARAAVGSIGVDFEIFEGLFTSEHTPPGMIPSQDVYSPEIASGWVVAQDLSSITFKIRRDSVWEKGYGPVTAHDVVFTYNSCVEEGSISNGGEQVAYGHQTPWTVQDDYTAIHSVRDGEFSPTWGVWMGGRGHLDGTYGLTSKNAYEQMGDEKFSSNIVGSGPYTVNFWTGHDEIEIEAKASHWRVTPHVAKVHIYEMPEDTTREAAYRTGEVDFASVSTKKVGDIIKAAGGLAVPAGMPWPQTIYMSGNYWAETCATCPEGEQDLLANPREGYLPDSDHPWIGRYGDETSMENARLVRWAMNLVIDRPSIVENVLGGFADVAYSYMHTQFPPGDPNFKEEWIVPFNPELAKEYMVKAGYPDGFAVEPWVSSDTAHLWDPEVFDAVAEMWRKHLNLDVTIDRSPYSTRRPEAVEKTMQTPWFHGWGLPPGGPKTASLCAGPGIMVGMELPDDICTEALKTEGEPSQAQRVQNNIVLADWLHHWGLTPTISAVPTYVLQGPRIKEWQPYFNPYFNNPSSVVLHD
jgi:ABC-type transport system substrate-binding protein